MHGNSFQRNIGAVISAANPQRWDCRKVAVPQPVQSPYVVARPRAVEEEKRMGGARLWLVGIPIPILIALYLFNVI